MDIIIEYPDGRTFQTTEEGYKQNHEPYGAKIVGYVGADGNTYPHDAEGKKLAKATVSAADTSIARETADRQAKAGLGETRAEITADADTKKKS